MDNPKWLTLLFKRKTDFSITSSPENFSITARRKAVELANWIMLTGCIWWFHEGHLSIARAIWWLGVFLLALTTIPTLLSTILVLWLLATSHPGRWLILEEVLRLSACVIGIGTLWLGAGMVGYF
jgi:hypothetical protein